MEPKPDYLGKEFAASFEDASVAAAYRYRPAFPPQTFEILNQLILDEPRRVLDAGCGTGALARYLTEIAEKVDAVDVSQVMIEQGQRLQNGHNPRLHWILGRIEEIRLDPPYSLITAGNSLHWMDWFVVMPRFADLLSRNGVLAIVDTETVSSPWDDRLPDIFRRYSINKGFKPYNLIDELTQRGLFTMQGQRQTSSMPMQQTMEEYIESFHARSAFSRQRMTQENALAFDQALRDLVSQYAPDIIHLQVYARISWGNPHGLKK